MFRHISGHPQVHNWFFKDTEEDTLCKYEPEDDLKYVETRISI
jgi:hypothetical protein